MLRFFLQADQVEKLIVPDSVQKARFTQAVTNLANVDIKDVWQQMVEWMIWTGIKLAIAIVVFYIARWLLHRLLTIIDVFFTRRGIDRSLHSFAMTAAKVVGYIAIFLILFNILGFESSSVLAIFASAGLAIGMALSGTLQNFAGGIMILVLRPYRIGDYIEAQGVSGTVANIGLFSTMIHTSDKKTIYIPNNSISTSIINNYSTSTTRRCSWKVSVAYGDDYDQIRDAMLNIIKRDERVLKEPAVYVRIDALADSAVVIEARAWVSNTDYWSVYDSVTEAFYKELPEHGANFPFPQLDVHLTKE
ncbi:MAG: mechanosensitive ion channel [Alistipes sp.]|nr:mechanosensitive ion channel [Alistipes sp.]